jgi:hypothetical protein
MSDKTNTVVRPMYVGARDIQTRTISGLAEATGNGATTGLTPSGILSAPIDGSGVYGVPGVELYCESGDGIIADVLFYSATGALVASNLVADTRSNYDPYGTSGSGRAEYYTDTGVDVVRLFNIHNDPLAPIAYIRYAASLVPPEQVGKFSVKPNGSKLWRFK